MFQRFASAGARYASANNVAAAQPNMAVAPGTGGIPRYPPMPPIRGSNLFSLAHNRSSVGSAGSVSRGISGLAAGPQHGPGTQLQPTSGQQSSTAAATHAHSEVDGVLNASPDLHPDHNHLPSGAAEQHPRPMFVQTGTSADKHHRIMDPRGFSHPGPAAHHQMQFYARAGRSAMSTAYIGIGSNLGARARHIVKAMNRIKGLPDTRITHTSLLYETRAFYDPRQPNFLNTVVQVQTFLHPRKLLAQLKDLERELGRTPDVGQVDPRVIDLDLLMFNSMQIQTPELTLPHSLLSERGFALRPLCDINPNIMHPVAGRSMLELLTRLVESERMSEAEEPVLRRDASAKDMDEYLARDSFTIRALHDRRCMPLDRDGDRLIYCGDRTFVFGVVMVTFGDKAMLTPRGKALPREEAVERVVHYLKEGADLVELELIEAMDSAQQEIDVYLPILQAVHAQCGPKIGIGVNTVRSQVARTCIEEGGASLINDWSGGELDKDMLRTVGELGAMYVVTHLPEHDQLVEPPAVRDQMDSGELLAHRVRGHFHERLEEAQLHGIPRWCLIVDPGLGLRGPSDTLELLRHMQGVLPYLQPLLCSVSRKEMITAALKKRQRGKDPDWEDVEEPDLVQKDLGTAAAITAAVGSGSDFVRVHDVPHLKHVLRVADQIYEWRRLPW